MKTKPLLLRVVAVVSSLTLFVLFVYSRAGGGSPPFYPQQSRTNMPVQRAAPNAPAKVAPNASNSSQESVQTSGQRSVIFSGSKTYSPSTTISGGKLPIPTPSAPVTSTAPPQTERQRTVLFSGSKSASPVMAGPANPGRVTVNESPADATKTLKPVPPAIGVPLADDPEFAAATDKQSLIGTLPRQQVEKPAPTKPLELKPQVMKAQVEKQQVKKPTINDNRSGNGPATEKRQVIMSGSKSLFVPQSGSP